MLKNKYLLIILILSFFISCHKNDSETKVRQQGVNQIISESRNVLVTDSRKPRSYGHPQTVYVFVDDHVWTISEPFLKESIERTFFTTEDETLFNIVLADINNIRNFNRYNNLVFLSDINSTSPVSNYVNHLMSENIIKGIAENRSSMFLNYNLWANDQIVLFFIGDGPTAIRDYIATNYNSYFRLLYDRFIARITFSSKRLKSLPDATFRELPFKMYLPETYRIFRKDLENNFISFILRSRENQERNPDMYFAVYWYPTENNTLDINWLAEKRADIAWNYYEEDEFDINEIETGTTKFADREVLFISGRWQNKKHFIGGAFKSFAFYEPELQMIYLIDTSVYFPAGNKLRYLLELEGFANTLVPIKSNNN